MKIKVNWQQVTTIAVGTLAAIFISNHIRKIPAVGGPAHKLLNGE